MTIVFSLMMVIAALVVIFRSVCVINKLHWTTHYGSYRHFLGLGISYAFLAVGALLAVIDAAHGTLSLAGMVIIFACAGLVLFDKRRWR